jgi:hypothetical protein
MHATGLLNSLDTQPTSVELVFSGQTYDCRETLTLPAVVFAKEITFSMEVTKFLLPNRGIELLIPRLPIPRLPDDRRTHLIHLAALHTLRFSIFTRNYIKGTVILDTPSLRHLIVRLSEEYYNLSGWEVKPGPTIAKSMEELAPLATRSKKLERITLEVVGLERQKQEVFDHMTLLIGQKHRRLYSDWVGEGCVRRGASGLPVLYRYTLTRTIYSPRSD